MKQLWLLTGGNGAGKSTFYELFLKPRGLPFINADLIARELYPAAPEQHSYDAARVAEVLRQELLASGSSFCFETVFSHPSKIDFVARAKALGYHIVLVFVHLAHPTLNLARVHQRVARGGHAVPDDKVLTRIPRTLNNLRAVLPLCNEVRLVDNSSADRPYAPVLTLREGVLIDACNPLPEWARGVLEEE